MMAFVMKFVSYLQTLKIVVPKNIRQASSTASSRKFLDGPIDPEVAFHSNQADTWWDRPVLPALNEVRVPFIKNGIIASGIVKKSGNSQNLLEGISILDVGCGGGILSEALARIGADVYGIDPSSMLINVAKKHALLDKSLQHNLKYECSNVHKFAESNKDKFDSVVISEVIEHVANKEKFLISCLACLKQHGSIFVTTPNRTWLANLLIVKLAERFQIIPIGTHDFHKFITPEEVKEMLQKFGCTVKHVEGVWFNIVNGKFSLSYSKSLMYALRAQKN